MKKYILSILLILPFIFFCFFRVYKSFVFNKGCTYQIERFFEEEDFERSKKHLNNAIVYLEKNNLTSGFTSILDPEEKEDLGYFYNKLKNTQEYFNNLSEEKFKENMKFRSYKNIFNVKSNIEIPEGISIYPNNFKYCVLALVLVLLCVFGVGFLVVFDVLEKDF